MRLLLLMLATAAICAIASGKSTVVIAPSVDDWRSALSEMPEVVRTKLASRLPILFDVKEMKLVPVHPLYYRPDTKRAIDGWSINLSAVVAQYNRLFGKTDGMQLVINDPRTFQDRRSPGGTLIHNFQLDWTVMGADGERRYVEAFGSSRGISVWKSSTPAATQDANRAFAVSFLWFAIKLNDQLSTKN